jgi:ABC-2 type transport system permease protein
MRILFALISASLRSLLANKKALFLRSSFMIINDILYIMFWYFIFRKTETLYGLTLIDVYRLLALRLISYGFATSISAGWKDFKYLIETGAMDVYLLRPAHPMIQAIFSSIELSAIGDFILGIGLFFLTSHDPIGELPLLIFMILAGGLAWLGACLCIYSLSFWKILSESTIELLFSLSLTISSYPEKIIGRMVHFIAFFLLPIGISIYLPARFASAPSPMGILAVTASSVFLLLLAKVIFDAGLKRYESGSGWTVHT